MITQTLTSDPAVGLELGRRLTAAARRHPRASRLQLIWARLLARQPGKLIASHV